MPSPFINYLLTWHGHDPPTSTLPLQSAAQRFGHFARNRLLLCGVLGVTLRELKPQVDAITQSAVRADRMLNSPVSILHLSLTANASRWFTFCFQTLHVLLLLA